VTKNLTKNEARHTKANDNDFRKLTRRGKQRTVEENEKEQLMSDWDKGTQK